MSACLNGSRLEILCCTHNWPAARNHDARNPFETSFMRLIARASVFVVVDAEHVDTRVEELLNGAARHLAALSGGMFCRPYLLTRRKGTNSIIG
jgi:hypothetical protein